MHKGSCLCGDVRFTISGPLRSVIACHCSQCRKMSGHFWASTSAPAKAIEVEGYTYVRWFKASDHACRGFCVNCGSSIFWKKLDQPAGSEEWSVAAGAFETEVPALHHHIYVGDKPSYYEIGDGTPQFEGSD